ncbi:MAG: hypothetical protein B6D44_10600 [Ignavibacteriales bacterium UTCHB2]|jgi:uncharacterized cupredoxin-like copper-binding protein|nr:MAG: hypothetical protein BWY38_02502 [Ignavibacteria bacterium ADurb.Bin266]OQY72189.1 MAG: hypothetical protein B6D44_10600 [Ignavibacteriales bacterium UTCHB2]HQI41749.1 DUF1573 domain-containing protein [Ignavibacteriaceae bacterium]
MIRNILIILLSLSITAFAQLMGPKVSVQQVDYDFGNITQGDIVSHTFILSNNGGDLLKITDVRASCGCTAANPTKRELKPGESSNLEVTFNSKGRKGPQVKTVNVTTNDPDRKDILLTIKCNIIEPVVKENKSGARIYFEETQHDFGKVKEGTKVEYTFKFENKGTEPLVVKDVKTSCGCTAAVVSSNTLKPGEVGSLKVGFDTKNRVGRNSKSVTIVSNDDKEPNRVLMIYAEVQKN